MMMLATMMMMLIANSLSFKQIYQWIEIRNEHIIIGANMREQFEEAKEIINDIIFMHIQDLIDIDGECEDEEEIKEAFKLICKLAEQSVK